MKKRNISKTPAVFEMNKENHRCIQFQFKNLL